MFQVDFLQGIISGKYKKNRERKQSGFHTEMSQDCWQPGSCSGIVELFSKWELRREHGGGVRGDAARRVYFAKGISRQNSKLMPVRGQRAENFTSHSLNEEMQDRCRLRAAMAPFNQESPCFLDQLQLPHSLF